VHSAYNLYHPLRSFGAPLFPLVSQEKATADLLPAAQRGDVATVQDCLSKKANIETKYVRSMLACEAVSSILFDLHIAIFRRGRYF